MAVFIDIDGVIRRVGKYREKYPLEDIGIENYFVSSITAQEIRDIIKKRFPLAFYGKHRKENNNREIPQ